MTGCAGILAGHAQRDSSAHGYDLMRVENEYKLNVPVGVAGDLWIFLQGAFGNDRLFLKKEDSTFRSTTATDHFTDQYFDNKRKQLLDAGNGIRYRSRLVLSDSTDRKNGRRLVQVKINHVNNKMLDRAEFKYRVDTARTDPASKDPLDLHPFLGLVAPEHRQPLILRLKEYGIAADSLFPTILIEQLRKRVYVFRGEQPFATLTIDSVTAKYQGEQRSFIELELELNEMNYTRSDSSGRADMERLNAMVKDTVMKAFPMLRQDQTPKYRKAYVALGIDGFAPTTEERTRLWPFAGGAIVIIIVALAARKRRKRASVG